MELLGACQHPTSTRTAQGLRSNTTPPPPTSGEHPLCCIGGRYSSYVAKIPGIREHSRPGGSPLHPVTFVALAPVSSSRQQPAGVAQALVVQGFHAVSVVREPSPSWAGTSLNHAPMCSPIFFRFFNVQLYVQLGSTMRIVNIHPFARQASFGA
jgi:hypothetical protein